ncbi:hypothetical protein BHF71_06825 [Vulcanibacillus modesticaldus]|uniref:Ion transport domain-containing protein n=1 Tax=Vulcanibacillus modesticaldus TaxID=337097 RepID=A0A1D2YWC1_9BACI|nr:ion transporter [Vulcanibacillus modesticaldus]OEF99983.1 hypothetical protein BHF71_06825 [Vulcanibacillus modesticaldus]
MYLKEQIRLKISKLPSKYKNVYDIISVILAIVVIITLTIEMNYNLTDEQLMSLHLIDKAILIIFAIDYFFRLYLANRKLKFIKENIFDLLAIIPLDYLFMSFRLARLFRILRVISISKRLWLPLLELLRTNKLHYVLSITTALVLFGSLGIMYFEDSIDSFGDALWWSIVTTTTVGYGDISPASTGGRIVAAILMFMGIGTIGMLTGSIATFFINRTKPKDLSLHDEIIELIKDKLDNLDRLSPNEMRELKDIIITLIDKHLILHKNDKEI